MSRKGKTIFIDINKWTQIAYHVSLGPVVDDFDEFKVEQILVVVKLRDVQLVAFLHFSQTYSQIVALFNRLQLVTNSFIITSIKQFNSVAFLRFRNKPITKTFSQVIAIQ